MSKASWMAFTSANCLDSPSPSAVSATCRVGLHTAAFHLRYFRTMWQDPSVNRAYCFLSSGSWLYSGDSSARVTSSSGDAPKSLPSGQSMITSRIPGRLRFPIWARCVVSATHLLHVASVAWCVEGTLSLNIQPRTGNRGAREAVLQCRPLLKQLECLHMLPESLFQWEYSGPRILCILGSRTPGVDLESPLVLSAGDSRLGHSPRLQCRAGF